jgi:hypothetical protein
MKISIGAKVTDGPTGGGNQFARSLGSFLTGRGHEVVFRLDDSDIDIILMVEPRRGSPISAFGPLEILQYLRRVNSNTLVVHRINECDERKGTKTVNAQLELANSIADHTVYIGSWLSGLFSGKKMSHSSSVIKNAADRSIYKFVLKNARSSGEKWRLVTHHWSPNWNKGWDIYALFNEKSDNNLDYELHYIGNKPTNIKAGNIFFHPPTTGRELAMKLNENHIYLSASLNEPAGMHHIEGASVGLPLVFRNSGALPEYCQGFGEMFGDSDSFWRALKQVTNQYRMYSERMRSYPSDVSLMGQAYLDLFEEMVEKRPLYLKSREKRIQSHPISSWKMWFKYYSYYFMHRLGFD